MTQTIFNQPVQTTLETLRQPSLAKAQQLPSIKWALAACTLIALLVVAFASMTPDNPSAGAIQRIAETSLYAWTIWWIWSLGHDGRTAST